MKKRTAVRLVAFSLSVSLVVMGLYLTERKNKMYYKNQLGNMYQSAHLTLQNELNEIALTIEKMLYTLSPSQVSSMSTVLLSRSESAKKALSELPFGDRLTVVNRFLSQVGNYSAALSKKMILNNTEDADTTENLKKLYDTATVIRDCISAAEAPAVINEKWGEVLQSSISDRIDEESLADSIQSIEESIDDYPTLIYDGPYSSHLIDKTSSLLKEKPEVTLEQSYRTLEKITQNAELSYSGKAGGELGVYLFSDLNSFAAVTVNGGYAAYYRKNRTVEAEKLTANQMFAIADSYLNQIGYKNMVKTYSLNENGILKINYAYLDGETLCYTDLIEVGVAEDNGEVLLLNASGYLMNHKSRSVPTPAYTSSDAATRLSNNLTVRSVTNALIPLVGREAYCFEFYCTAENGDEILVYLNTVTLAEEEILILLRTEGGTLVK